VLSETSFLFRENNLLNFIWFSIFIEELFWMIKTVFVFHKKLIKRVYLYITSNELKNKKDRTLVFWNLGEILCDSWIIVVLKRMCIWSFKVLVLSTIKCLPSFFCIFYMVVLCVFKKGFSRIQELVIWLYNFVTLCVCLVNSHLVRLRIGCSSCGKSEPV